MLLIHRVRLARAERSPGDTTFFRGAILHRRCGQSSGNARTTNYGDATDERSSSRLGVDIIILALNALHFKETTDYRVSSRKRLRAKSRGVMIRENFHQKKK